MSVPHVRRTIVFIHGGNEIDAGTANGLRGVFATEFDLRLEDVSVVDADSAARLRAILDERGDDVFFFLSSNFWALNVRDGEKLLHDITGIPLVVLLHDHPAYFFHYLSPSLDGTILFAPGDDAVDFVEKHYPVRARVLSNPSFLPRRVDAGPPDFEQFSGRKNVLLCPFNLTIFGSNMDRAWASIKALPERRMRRAIRLVDASLTDCVTPLHVISERIASSGDPEIAVEDLRLVLDFVKVWRRDRLVRAIIDLPVLVTSEYVPADLELKYPEKFARVTVDETLPLYRSFRFVVNSTPLLTGSIHDRVVQAMTNNAVCVSDPSAILQKYFQDGRDIAFVDYASADIAEKLAAYLDDPARAFSLTANAYETRHKQTWSRESYEALFRAVAALNESRPRR